MERAARICWILAVCPFACRMLLSEPTPSGEVPAEGGKDEPVVRIDASDASVPIVPFCASRKLEAGSFCDDFDTLDAGSDFLGWARSDAGANGGSLEYSDSAFSPSRALRTTLPLGVKFARAYLYHTPAAVASPSRKYHVSYMVRGGQPVGDEYLLGPVLTFQQTSLSSAYNVQLILIGLNRSSSFKVGLSEQTQNFPGSQVDRYVETGMLPFAYKWIPVELFFDFGSNPPKASASIGGNAADFSPPLEAAAFDRVLIRFGIERYNTTSASDAGDEFYFDNFLFEVL